jgi:hypothetical protein
VVIDLLSADDASSIMQIRSYRRLTDIALHGVDFERLPIRCARQSAASRGAFFAACTSVTAPMAADSFRRIS